ncbi:hypothetical protein [Arthrobacter methylotrophus]|uniref:hypothetical protein n=1 Tax=Arthrobacter methylotrophus TaxID=121291 RepID=UPI0031E59C31
MVAQGVVAGDSVRSPGARGKSYDAADNASPLRGGTQAFGQANQLCWSSTTIVTRKSAN